MPRTFGSLRAYEPGLMDKARWWMQDTLTPAFGGDAKAAGAYVNDKIMPTAEWLPFAGGAGDAARGVDDFNKGDYWSSALNLGMAGLGALGPVGKLGSVAGKNALKSFNKADLDPLGYSATKLPKHFDDIEVGIQQTAPNLARKQIDIADLEGKVMTPLYGDRSAAGGLVTKVDDLQLANPVYREGGPDFMVGPSAQADDAIWASGGNIVKRLADRAGQLRNETGREVVGATVAMGPDAVDFTTFAPRVLAEMLPGSKITKKAFKSFDQEMKKVDKNWPGADTDGIGDYLAKSPTGVRKAFIRTMEKAPFQNAGFPNVGSARKAVTEPDLYNTPNYSTGFAIGKFDDANPIIGSPSVPHSTYDKQIKGEYLGGFGSLVPQGMIWRDAYNAMENSKTKLGEPFSESHKTYALKTKLPGQIVDAQMVDEISKYLEQINQGR